MNNATEMFEPLRADDPPVVAGNIALLVVQVKSTALPTSGVSFLMADVTVWGAS